MNVGSVFDSGLIFFAVLSLGALSGYFSERAGIVNIGINGTMTFGALFYCIYAGLLNGSALEGNSSAAGSLGIESFLLPMILSAISTILVGLLFGYSTIKLKADHVIAGTAINLLGTSLGAFLTNPLGNSILGVEDLRNPYKKYLPISEGFFGSTLIVFLIVLVLIIVLIAVMKWSKFGLRFVSIGENPNAADSQGINVIKYQWTGIIIASVLAGLAGSIFMYRDYQLSFIGDVDGLGFLALAIMITGSWRIPLIGIVSFLFAILVSISKQTIRDVDPNLLLIIPYAASLAFLIFFSKKIRGPKYAGMHFDKSRR